MRVLVTGASGFVGQHMCRYLSQKGFSVIGTSRSAQGFLSMPDLRRADWNSWLNSIGKVDAIIHLAGRAHRMDDATKRPEDIRHEYIAENTEATYALAKAAAKHGIKKFIFMSSIKVMGEGEALPYKKIDMPHPQDPYGESKLLAEKKLSELSDETGLQVEVIRPPLIYGTGVKANLLNLSKVIQKGIPLPLKSVLNKRSLVFIDNLSDLVAQLLNRSSGGFNVWHVSDGVDLSTAELIRFIAAAINKRPRLFSFPPIILRFLLKLLGREHLYTRLAGSLQVDIEATKSELNWNPPFSPQEGFKKSFS